jgi:KaiC/GvpD/RAD55 family RecA-like ATPase
MAKVPSGVTGLDKLTGGGFEEGTVNLVCGKTGTGKSIFCSQVIYNGVMKNKQKGIYITTEETANNIRRQVENFGWDLQTLEKKGWVKIIEFEPFDISTLTTNMTKLIEKFDAKRIVIDSVSMFELYLTNVFEIRKALFKVIQKIREMNRLGLVTAEILEDSNSLSRFGVIEFMVDSVILLQYLGLAKYKRSLMIRKMRMSNHSTNIHPFEISKKGFTILR